MSDFLFSTRPEPPGGLDACLRRYLGPVSAAIEEYHGSWGSLAVARAHHDPAAVVRLDEHRLSVVAGDPLVHGGGGAPGWWFDGQRREWLHRLLGSDPPVAWDQHLDGHFALLAVDLRTGRGRVVTDRFGFIPVYRAEPAGGHLIVATHPDAAAAAGGRESKVDPVSAAEVVLTWRCLPPHTLYDGVTQSPVGSEQRFDGHGAAGSPRRYWAPVERNPFRSRQEAVVALREAVRNDVALALGGQGDAGLLLSGGEDSRAILGAVPDGQVVRSFTFSDRESSREVRTARAVARRHGSELLVGLRAPDHYLAGLATVAHAVGSQHLFADVHAFGFHERLGLRDLAVVLGGLSANTLLKGRYQRPGGPTVPLPVLREPLHREELVQAVAERRERFRRQLGELRPESVAEWMVIYPFAARNFGGNLHGHRRLFRAHEPFHANAVLEVAAAVPMAWKRGGSLFREAMRPFFARTWAIPHARAGLPYFPRSANLLLTPLLEAGRGLRTLLSGEIGTHQGPWPRWDRLLDSPAGEAIRRAHPVVTTPLEGIFESASPASVEAATAQWAPFRRLMLPQAVILGR
jgi:hypothetical protein